MKKRVIPKKVYLLFGRADGSFALDTYRSRAKAATRRDGHARFGEGARVGMRRDPDEERRRDDRPRGG